MIDCARDFILRCQLDVIGEDVMSSAIWYFGVATL